MMIILLERLKPQLEPYLLEEQAGFGKKQQHNPANTDTKIDSKKGFKNKAYNSFVDFQKAFNTMELNVIWAVLSSYGVQAKLIRVLRQLYEDSNAAVKMGKDIGEWFMQTLGTNQGEPFSSDLHNLLGTTHGQ